MTTKLFNIDVFVGERFYGTIHEYVRPNFWGKFELTMEDIEHIVYRRYPSLCNRKNWHVEFD